MKPRKSLLCLYVVGMMVSGLWMVVHARGVSDQHRRRFTSMARDSEGIGVEVNYDVWALEGWTTAGANPERTSWVPEEVRGNLVPAWYKQFEPYILARTQIVATQGVLYVATARGLYALDAKTGEQRWVYPTELPLGDTPTVYDNVVYIGGLDKKMHAIDAQTGVRLWVFDGAGQGFQGSPLVIPGMLYSGNRDGYLYAIHTEGLDAGRLAWRYKSGGPILQSAAYRDGIVYFAANDARAYALNAVSGSLVWKSAKFPGGGFHSWWPVIHGDYVVFSGNHHYRAAIRPGPQTTFSNGIEKGDIYPDYATLPRGTLVAPDIGPQSWSHGARVLDLSKSNPGTTAVTEYFESKPWRRTYFVLNRHDGVEVTYDFDQDQKPEYAPILWVGAKSGTRYPPVVGSDGLLYQSNDYMSDSSIPGGHISGWKVDSPFISLPQGTGWNAVDEPQAYAAGGQLMYWNRCCDRVGRSFNYYLAGGNGKYFSYDLDWGPSTDANRPPVLPGYSMYHNPDLNATPPDYSSPFASFGRNGAYGFHGDTNPPIPYDGMVYMHRGNTVIAWASTGGKIAKPRATKRSPNDSIKIPTKTELQARLDTEVQKMIAAGHLRPGYQSSGLWDFGARNCGDDFPDYWHHPADTIYTLSMAIPHLSTALQQQAKDYLQSEFTRFPPYKYNHVGWASGAAREILDLPPEVESDLANNGPKTSTSFSGWSFNPFAFYAMWKYAQVFPDQARTIFDTARNQSNLMNSFNNIPSDSVLAEFPFAHNAYIAGYNGYLELEKMAGYSESAMIEATLNNLLTKRAQNFSKDSPYADMGWTGQRKYCRSFNVARNFLYLTPELGAHLRQNANLKVVGALSEYYELAPYWFVSKAEVVFGEGVNNHLYDAPAVFQAKALILGQPYTELAKYIDVPAFERGDLFHIQNLIHALEVDGAPAPPPRPRRYPRQRRGFPR